MRDARPTIGICTSLEHARWGVWDQRAALLPFSYVTAIQSAGGLAVMIPPDPGLSEHPDEMLDQLDGLILAGGADIDPSAYEAEPHPATKGTVPERDRSEIALARRAVERDMPVLGICRGMQLLNVALGGTLRQHIPDLVDTTITAVTRAASTIPTTTSSSRRGRSRRGPPARNCTARSPTTTRASTRSAKGSS